MKTLFLAFFIFLFSLMNNFAQSTIINNNSGGIINIKITAPAITRPVERPDRQPPFIPERPRRQFQPPPAQFQRNPLPLTEEQQFQALVDRRREGFARQNFDK